MSNLADGVALLALPLLAIQVTRDPVAVSGLRVALTLPWLLFGLLAGVLTDRLDRRRLMVWGNLMRGAALALLGTVALTDQLGLLWLYAAGFLLGIGETWTDTAAQAILPAVVPREGLRRANGRLYSAQVVLNEFAGAPLAGLLVTVSVAAAAFTPAALYLAAGVLVALLPGRYAARRTERTSIATDLREGLRGLAGDRGLRRLVAYSAGVNLVNAAFFAVFVLFAVGAGAPMGLTAPQYSLLLIAVAAGAIGGAQLTERISGKLRTAPVLSAAAVLLGLCLALPALTTHPLAVGAALAVAGAAVAVGNVLAVSMRQEIVPDRLLGRVTAGVRMVVFGALPVGSLLGGVIAATWSPRLLFVVLGVASLLLAFVPHRLPGAAPPLGEPPAGPRAGDITAART